MKSTKPAKKGRSVNAVVLLSQGTAGGDLLQTHQLESLALEAAEDFAHQTALDAVGLDGDKRAFGHEWISMKSAAIVSAGHPAWQAQAMGKSWDVPRFRPFPTREASG